MEDKFLMETIVNRLIVIILLVVFASPVFAKGGRGGRSSSGGHSVSGRHSGKSTVGHSRSQNQSKSYVKKGGSKGDPNSKSSKNRAADINWPVEVDVSPEAEKSGANK